MKALFILCCLFPMVFSIIRSRSSLLASRLYSTETAGLVCRDGVLLCAVTNHHTQTLLPHSHTHTHIDSVDTDTHADTDTHSQTNTYPTSSNATTSASRSELTTGTDVLQPTDTHTYAHRATYTNPHRDTDTDMPILVGSSRWTRFTPRLHRLTPSLAVGLAGLQSDCTHCHTQLRAIVSKHRLMFAADPDLGQVAAKLCRILQRVSCGGEGEAASTRLPAVQVLLAEAAVRSAGVPVSRLCRVLPTGAMEFRYIASSHFDNLEEIEEDDKEMDDSNEKMDARGRGRNENFSMLDGLLRSRAGVQQLTCDEVQQKISSSLQNTRYSANYLVLRSQ